MPQEKGDQAHGWAAKIFDLSTKCLMAHSIRAVEKYLEEELPSPTQRYAHRIKLKAAKPQPYLGRRAVAYMHVGWSEILVDDTIGSEDQRRGIAHELGHILFAKSNPDGKSRIVRDAETESACNVFEKDLCTRHHNFYKNPATLPKLLFHSLAD